MKHLLFTFFTLLTFTAFGQPTGNIEEDTARANRLYEEIVKGLTNIEIEQGARLKESINFCNQSLITLKDIETVFQKANLQDKVVEVKGDVLMINFYLKNIKDTTIIKKGTDIIKYAKIHLGDENHPALFKTYFALSQCAWELRDSDMMEFYLEKAYVHCEKPSIYYARIIFDLVTYIYFSTKQTDKIEQIIQELEVIIESHKDGPNYIINLYRFKITYHRLRDDHEQVILYGEKFISEAKKIGLRETQLGAIYAILTDFYFKSNNFDKAESYMERTMNGMKSDPYSLGTYYIHIADLYYHSKNYQKAIDCNNKAIELLRQGLTERGSNVYNSGFLVYTYAKNADYYRIINDIENAEKCWETILTEFNPDLMKPRYPNYALFLCSKKEYQEALTFMQKALVEYSTTFKSMAIKDNPPVNDSPLTKRSLEQKAILLYKIGKELDSATYLNISIETSNLVLEHSNKNPYELNGFELSKRSNNATSNELLSTQCNVYYNLFQLNDDKTYIEKMFDVTERRKTRLLLETLTPVELPKNINQKGKDLINKKNQYEQKLYLKKDSVEYYNNELLRISQEIQEHNEIIIKKFPKQSSYYYNVNYVKSLDIQEYIEENTLWVEYIVSEESYIFSISKSAVNVVKFNFEDLSNDIKSLQQLLKDPLLIQQSKTNEFIKVSHRLYNQLIKPIEDDLTGKKNIIFVLEDKLFNLPLEVLLPINEQKPFNELDFLIKNYDISYQYSATIYEQLKNKPAIEDKSLLAFAPVFTGDKVGSTRDIDFLIDSLYRGVENERFAALPNTKKEVQTIAKTLEGQGQTTVLLESDATKTNYNKAVQKQQYQFVHIATHGLVNFSNPRLSALACYSETDNVEQQLLFANEIQMQDIQADLVVLSSCESGIGQLVAGEGLIALNRSYIYSGANNVLFSLWKVSDKYSAELMINFYKFYLETNDYSAALRQAKLKMLKNPTTANPRYWAAFVLIGE